MFYPENVICDELKAMLDMNVIKESRSDWNSLVVLLDARHILLLFDTRLEILGYWQMPLNLMFSNPPDPPPPQPHPPPLQFRLFQFFTLFEPQ